jgi:hypothetical protein
VEQLATEERAYAKALKGPGAGEGPWLSS